jgi:hypothetical protein
MYEVVKIPYIKENGEVETKDLRFAYSRTGEQQFIQDFFLDNDTCYKELGCKVNGITNTIPFGIVMMKAVTIDNSSLISGDNRLLHQEEVITEFGEEMRNYATRGELRPHKINFDVKIKCGSDLERLVIFETISDIFYKARKFYISWAGFEMLDCLVSFPEDISMEKQFEFKAEDNEKHPLLEFSLEVFTYKPVLKRETAFEYANYITNKVVNIKIDEGNKNASGSANIL